MAYTKSPLRIPHFHIVTTFQNGTGTANAVMANASMESVFTNDSNASDVRTSALLPITFDMLDPTLASTTVTAAGVTTTIPKIAALLRQMCIDRAAAQGIS